MLATGNDYARKVVAMTSVAKADEKSKLDTYDEQRLKEFESNPEGVVTTDKMSKAELEDFRKIVYAEAETLNLPTHEDVEVYAKAILDLYTPGSTNYLNLVATTDKIIDGIDETIRMYSIILKVKMY